MTASQPIKGLWYLAAVFVALIGWNIGVAIAGGAWDAVRAAPITLANTPLDARGKSVAVFTDALQADLAFTCRWKSAASAKAHPIPAAPVPLKVTDDGLNWQLIAFEPRGQDDMQVRCRPTRGRADTGQYAYAVVDGFLQRAMLGNAITLASLALAVVVAIAVFMMRRRGRITP